MDEFENRLQQLQSIYDVVSRDLQKVKSVCNTYFNSFQEQIDTNKQDHAAAIDEKLPKEDLIAHLENAKVFEEKINVFVKFSMHEMQKIIYNVESKISNVDQSKVSNVDHLQFSESFYSKLTDLASEVGMNKDLLYAEIDKLKKYYDSQLNDVVKSLKEDINQLKLCNDRFTEDLKQVQIDLTAYIEKLQSLNSRVFVTEKTIEHIYLTFKRNNLEVKY